MIKCWICGKEATKSRYLANGLEETTEKYTKASKHKRSFCDECFTEFIRIREAENYQYIELKKKRMFEAAVDKLERQELDLEDYKEAIETVEEYNIANLDKFDSSYEIIAAIILIKNRIHIKPQYKIGKYQVDFVLPERFIVLEIDGERHKSKKDSDSVRDYRIKNALGDSWEIIRIPAEYLDKKAKNLPKAIKAIEERREHIKLYWKD